MRTSGSGTSFERVRVAGMVVGFVALVAAGWLFWPSDFSAEVFAGWFRPHRHAWYALPGVVAAFVLLGLALVPVLLLITATGVAFGPWLGPLYAMAGCLASASTGFAIGRWVGRHRIERHGGRTIARLADTMSRNGTLAVFLLRKVPLPFLLANVVAGAARVAYRDFLVGTVLGMTAIVVALAGLGYHAARLFEDPSPQSVGLALVAAAVPLTLAWFINRSFRQRSPR